MIPGKEHLIFFEQLQIDPFLKVINFGGYDPIEVFFIDEGPESQDLKARVRYSLKELMKIYKYEVINPSDSPNSAVSLKIPFEKEGAGYRGAELTVIHNDGSKAYGEYFNVTVIPVEFDYSPFQEWD